MSNNAFFTRLRKTGTHPFKMIPDPRSEKYLETPLEEGKKLIHNGQVAVPLLERLFRFGLRQALIDFASELDMDEFEPTVTELVENEVTYAESDSKSRAALQGNRRELMRKLIDARKAVAATFKPCVEKSVYLSQFGLLKPEISLFRMKKEKDPNSLPPEKLLDLIERNPEFNATREELLALTALRGKSNIINGYIVSRQRLFEAKLTKGNVLFRILVQNFDTYISNLVTYRLNQSNPAFEEMLDKEARREYFKLSAYPSFISQEGIDEYNAMLNGKQIIAAGTNRITDSLNREIREYNAKHAKDEDFVRIKPFKPLYKQILGIAASEEEEEQIGFQTLSNQEEFVEEVEKWIGWYDQPENMRQAIGLVDRITRTDGLYIRQTAVNSMSRLLCESPMELRTRLVRAGFKSEAITVNDHKVEAYRLTDLLSETVLDRDLFSQYFDNQLKAILLSGEERRQWLKTLTEPFAGKTFLQINPLPTVIESLRGCVKNNLGKAAYAGPIERLQTVCSRFTSLMNLIVQDDENNLADNPLKELVDQYFTELMENTHYEGVLVRGYLLTKPNNQHKIPIQFGLYDFGSGWSRSKADIAGLFIVREPSGNPDSPYYYHLCCPNNYLPKPLRAGKYQQQLESHPGDDGWGLMHFNQINDKLVFSAILYNNNFLSACEGYDEIREALMNKETRNQWTKSDDPVKQQQYLAFVKHLVTTGLCKERYHFDEEKVAACATLNDLIDYMIEDAYVLEFNPFDHAQLEKDIEAGRIFSFKLHTRKLYKPHTRQSQHEQLFLAAMRGDGISLQGGVQVFYRDVRVNPNETFVHKAGTILLDKYDRNGQLLVDESGKSCYRLLLRYLNRDNDLFATPLSPEENAKAEALYQKQKDALVTKVFRNSIVKNARYTKPQWTMHLPLLTNRSGLKDNNVIFTDALEKQFVRAYESKDYRILSLMFSPRNLIYLTLIDRDGKIIEQRSLNHLPSNKAGRLIDYHSQIVTRMRQKQLIQRDLQSNVENAESTWGKEDEIKGAREGYISLVVYLVAQYMRDGKTLLVMDDVRDKVKGTLFDSNQLTSIQRQIIAKLACLRLRNIPMGQPGSVNKPITLCKQVTTNSALIGRNGMVYITDLSFFNRIIDPTTGFMNLLPSLSDLTVKAAKALLDSFDEMRYDPQRDLFTFSYTPNRLKVPAGKLSLKSDQPMTFTTEEADRYQFAGYADNGSPIVENYNDITQRIKTLLAEGEVPYADGQNILPRLARSTRRSSIHMALLQLLRCLLRMDSYHTLRPEEEGYYSAAEGGLRVKHKNAIDETRGYVLALRGLAYTYKYRQAVERCTHEEINMKEATRVTLEDLAAFYKDFADIRETF